MTIRELLEIIETLKSANLLRDESRVEMSYRPAANGIDDEDTHFEVRGASRELHDRLTLRA